MMVERQTEAEAKTSASMATAAKATATAAFGLERVVRAGTSSALSAGTILYGLPQPGQSNPTSSSKNTLSTSICFLHVGQNTEISFFSGFVMMVISSLTGPPLSSWIMTDVRFALREFTSSETLTVLVPSLLSKDTSTSRSCSHSALAASSPSVVTQYAFCLLWAPSTCPLATSTMPSLTSSCSATATWLLRRPRWSESPF